MDPRKNPNVSKKSNQEWVRDRENYLAQFRELIAKTEQNKITVPEMAYKIVGEMLPYNYEDKWSEKLFDLAGHLETYPDAEIDTHHSEYQELKTLIEKGFNNVHVN
jgi:hypothetical protein